MARLAHRFIVLCALLALPSAARAAVTLDLYGTFESMGVTVTLAAGDDPDQDASASVEYRAVNGSFAGGLPLVRLSLHPDGRQPVLALTRHRLRGAGQLRRP